jgi:hypothetical protein
LRGHFLSLSGDDGVIWTAGCFNHGMAYVVSRPAGRWELKTQLGNLETYSCHKIRLADGRDALVCLYAYFWQAGVDYHVAYLDLLADGALDLLNVTDASQNCGFNPGFDPEPPSKPVPVARTFIRGVEFRTQQGRPLGLSIILESGQKVMNPEDCSPDTIPVRESRVEFAWRENGYVRTSK